MIFILPFLVSAVSVAVGGFIGVLTTHTAGEKDRQAAKHHRQVANELVEKYANIKKQYYELADESQKQIDDLTRQIALGEIEKDCLRLALRLQQSLIYLMWEIDKEPTAEILNQFKLAVEQTNYVLYQLNEELIIVPSDYYQRISGVVPKPERRLPQRFSFINNPELEDIYNRIYNSGNRLLQYLNETRNRRIKECDIIKKLQNFEDNITKALYDLSQYKSQAGLISRLTDILDKINKSAQDTAYLCNVDIRGWDLEFEQLKAKIFQYQKNHDAAKTKTKSN
ncbi:MULTISPECIES: hypothetical protein [Nostocales]|uniref:Uncharacterized protein n=1 Tax=Aphanizomenon flos-aquae FACHB-1040 TaxID=2692887 RepID=A0ABR8BU57_APHFL|nr:MULTISPECIES: hypothetical protein [Nostocales]ALB40190.1 hypothetical protein AA650_06660 [Anabaena sp. WA102]MBD2277009.1 hypothetical protein [Aphanizomenon flos-aquae FACHB-1040]OBQ20583.1 MAG: hypothetical protein AN486_06530 [Anabaena sp. AL93]